MNTFTGCWEFFLPTFLMVRPGKVIASERRAKILEISRQFQKKLIHRLVSLKLELPWILLPLACSLFLTNIMKSMLLATAVAFSTSG